MTTEEVVTKCTISASLNLSWINA